MTPSPKPFSEKALPKTEPKIDTGSIGMDYLFKVFGIKDSYKQAEVSYTCDHVEKEATKTEHELIREFWFSLKKDISEDEEIDLSDKDNAMMTSFEKFLEADHE